MDGAIEFTQQGQFKPLEDIDHLVGRRVEYQDELGTIKYCGPLKHDDKHPDANHHWLGVQWDNAHRGRHNGTVDGYEYFKCNDDNNSGTLLKLDKANFGTNIYDAIHLRYFNIPGKTIGGSMNAKGESIEYDEEVYFETIKKFKKKVEFVGFNKIWQKINDLKNLRDLSLPFCKVSDIGPDGALGKVLPNIRNLSLEGNLLFDWNQVFLLGRELKNLTELSLSGNKLAELEDDIGGLKEIKVNNNHTTISEAPLNVFNSLRTIVLINMNLTWKNLNKVLPAFFNVSSLVLCSNQLNDFENLTYTGENFKNLEFLNLEYNKIKLFEGIKKFKDAPKLSKLTLNMNGMKDLGSFTGFEHVNTVIMEENNITDFTIFSQLNQFPRLETLRVTKNPISKKFNALHIRQRAIAEIKNLKNINGGELKKYERKDCEIYYLRNTFHEFFADSKQTAFDYDFADFEKYCHAAPHPRIPELIKMYGNPYDESVKNQPKDQPVRPKMASLIGIKLNAFSGPYLGKPAVKKKFTDNTLITNLKAMLAKQFGIPATKQKIYCKADPKDPFVLMDEDLKDLKYYGIKEGHEIWVGDTEL